MFTDKRYLYLVGTETRVVKIKMSVDKRAATVVKVFRAVVKIFTPVVGGSMLFAGAFKMVVGVAYCMNIVRMSVVKTVMSSVRIQMLNVGIAMLFEGNEMLVAGIVMLFEEIEMLVVGIVMLFVEMKKAVIKIAMQVAQWNEWIDKTGKTIDKSPCTIAILQTICSMDM